MKTIAPLLWLALAAFLLYAGAAAVAVLLVFIFIFGLMKG